jgi:hypothetical protein
VEKVPGERVVPLKMRFMKVVKQATPPQPLPPLVAALGYGGLIPFVVAAIAHITQAYSERVDWLFGLVAYGAVILSFVGALHWGFAMLSTTMPVARRTQAYVWSVIPALLGFLALVIASPLSCSLLILGFALAYWQDADLANRIDLPEWYPRLRAHLSIVASLCLAAGVLV